MISPESPNVFKAVLLNECSIPPVNEKTPECPGAAGMDGRRGMGAAAPFSQALSLADASQLALWFFVEYHLYP